MVYAFFSLDQILHFELLQHLAGCISGDYLADKNNEQDKRGEKQDSAGNGNGPGYSGQRVKRDKVEEAANGQGYEQ